MLNNNTNYHRRSIRLPDYDYTQPGAYFVTICTWNRKCLFGEVINSEMILNRIGQVVQQEWLRLRIRFPLVDFPIYTFMPNHVHGIIFITEAMNPKGSDDTAYIAGSQQGKTTIQVVSGSLGAIVRAFKASVTWRLHAAGLLNQVHVWQRNYYEHVIRNEEDLQSISDYIESNPQNWQRDRLFTLI